MHKNQRMDTCVVFSLIARGKERKAEPKTK